MQYPFMVIDLQLTEILRSLGDDVGSDFHDDATGGFSAYRDIKEALGVGPALIGYMLGEGETTHVLVDIWSRVTRQLKNSTQLIRP